MSEVIQALQKILKCIENMSPSDINEISKRHYLMGYVDGMIEFLSKK